jgi:hypothetical protein
MSKPETKFVDPKFFATAEGLAMLRAQLAEARAKPQPKKTFKRTQPKSHWM